MSKTAVDQWDTTAANNTDIGGIALSNSTSITQLDDITRELMAQVRTGLFGPAAMSGMLYGLTLSNGTDATNDIDIAAGITIDSTNARFMELGSPITKQLDAAWAVGTNAGGLDTGSIANTTYHVWLIMRSDTGVVDALFSTSASSPTMPASYDYKRRIGSVVRSSGAIKPFVQDGDVFTWKVAVADIAVNNSGTSAVTRTLSVPIGVRVRAFGTVALTSTSASATALSARVSDLSTTDTAAGLPTNSQVYGVHPGSGATRLIGRFEEFTNTSGQVRSREVFSDASTTLGIDTHGYIDMRGRL